MSSGFFPVGKRVYITRYGPLKGLRGTIRRVRVIMDDERCPFCLYLIALDQRWEPLWFKYTEVAPLETTPFAVQAHWD